MGTSGLVGQIGTANAMGFTANVLFSMLLCILCCREFYHIFLVNGCGRQGTLNRGL